MERAMILEVVCDSAKLPFRDTVVLDDGLVVLSSEEGSDDLLLLSLIEGSMWHGAKLVRQSPLQSNGCLRLFQRRAQTFEWDCVLEIEMQARPRVTAKMLAK